MAFRTSRVAAGDTWCPKILVKLPTLLFLLLRGVEHGGPRFRRNRAPNPLFKFTSRQQIYKHPQWYKLISTPLDQIQIQRTKLCPPELQELGNPKPTNPTFGLARPFYVALAAIASGGITVTDVS